VDVLVPTTMKNAAKCDKQCELQNSEFGITRVCQGRWNYKIERS